MLKNKKFQEFILGADRNTVRNVKQNGPAQSQDEDMLEAHGRVVLGEISGQKKGMFGKTDVFDNFICDLFSNKLDLSLNKSLKDASTMFASNASMTLPLDQSLLISTAKKQNVQMLLNNLSSSSKSKESGLLSMDDIRNAARVLGDVSSFNNRSVANINFLNVAAPI